MNAKNERYNEWLDAVAWTSQWLDSWYTHNNQRNSLLWSWDNLLNIRPITTTESSNMQSNSHEYLREDDSKTSSLWLETVASECDTCLQRKLSCSAVESWTSLVCIIVSPIAYTFWSASASVFFACFSSWKTTYARKCYSPTTTKKRAVFKDHSMDSSHTVRILWHWYGKTFPP